MIKDPKMHAIIIAKSCEEEADGVRVGFVDFLRALNTLVGTTRPT